MRVLHLNAGNLYGGVETFLTTLVREAGLTRGMVSEFAVCFEGRFSKELAALGRPPFDLGPVRLSRPHSLVRARRALSGLLRRESFDVVVCHQPWACVVFGPVIRAAGFPLTLWIHMAGDGRHWLERLARRTRPDFVVCNSRFTAACLSRWLPQAHVEFVYYPVTLNGAEPSSTLRASLREAFETPEDDVVIVQVSRLEESKGQRVLLSALATLRDLPHWTCWIVGGAQRAAEMEYLGELKTLASQAGIDRRVRFVGERSDVAAVMSAADIYCQPNTAPEAFGLTFVEALHAGLPVVTSAIGGACEIVDESCGVLIPPSDVATLATVLQDLVVHPDRNAKLGLAGRHRPETLCDAPRQMQRVEQVLGAVARSETLA